MSRQSFSYRFKKIMAAMMAIALASAIPAIDGLAYDGNDGTEGVKTDIESAEESELAEESEAAEDFATESESVEESEVDYDETHVEDDVETDEEYAEEADEETDEIGECEEIDETDECEAIGEIDVVEDSVVGATSTVKLNPTYKEAVNTYTEISVDECTFIEAINTNANDYGRYASVAYSNMAYLADGTIVRFQGYDGTGKYLVQYFDSDLNYISGKTINAELPLFGGFYSDGTSFYVLSGQKNLSFSDSVEVYRVTKYDKNWNRNSTVASLFGAYTAIPFDAGSARFIHSGNQLIVRTCHEMYNGHQASVMMSINTTTMAITGSQYSVSNIGNGYTSHSFNETIKLDDGYMVAVDHGDANYRGLCLVRYKNKLSLSSYSNSAYGYNILPFAGAHGDNDTGGTLGGFEVSSTNYLVAYALNDQSDYKNSKTRNIYIASINKDALIANPVEDPAERYYGLMLNNFDIQYIQFTNYAEGDTTARNPYLVKLGSDSMLLMWSRADKVYYCKLDGKGQLVGNVYYMPGALSDCQPIKVGEKIVWYEASNKKTILYAIDINDLSKTKTEALTMGHEYQVVGIDGSKVTNKCTRCGDTFEITTFSEFSLWFNHSNEIYTTYSGCGHGSRLSWDCSQPFRFWYNNFTPSDVENTEMRVESADEDIIRGYEAYASDMGMLLVGNTEGTTTVTFSAKYNSNAKKTLTVTVKHHYSVTGTKDGGSIQIETCSGCGAVKETVIAPKNPELVGASAKLNSSVSMDFCFTNLPQNGSVVIDGPSGKITKPVSSLTKDSTGKYTVSYDVIPRYMRSAHSIYIMDSSGAKISFTNGSGTTASLSWKLIGYLNGIVNGTTYSQAEKDLAKALIQYCDNIAYYFDSSSTTNGVVYTKYSGTIDFSSYRKVIYSSAGTTYAGVKGVEYVGSSLMMLGAPGMRHYFVGNLSGCSVTIGGVSKALVKVADGLYYCEDLSGCNLSSLNVKREIIMTKSSTGERWKMNYSVMSYCSDAYNAGNEVLMNLSVSIYNVYAAELKLNTK